MYVHHRGPEKESMVMSRNDYHSDWIRQVFAYSILKSRLMKWVKRVAGSPTDRGHVCEQMR